VDNAVEQAAHMQPAARTQVLRELRTKMRNTVAVYQPYIDTDRHRMNPAMTPELIWQITALAAHDPPTRKYRELRKRCPV